MTVKRQAELLEINRSSVYKKHPVKAVSDEELFLMRLIDGIHTAEPTWGYRMITAVLRKAYKLSINRKRVRRIMRDMGIYTIYPKPNLSRRYHAQYVRPYLLRNLAIVRPNQVWGVDITYIRMKKGFMYLFVIIDWYSRYIVDFELSSTIDKSFVLNCLKRALASHQPETINSDQGGHFTNPDYIKLIEESGVKISMDGKGQCLDNVRTERFFRTLKYEDIYLKCYEDGLTLYLGMKAYFKFYNQERLHQSLDYETPAMRYGAGGLTSIAA